MAFRLRTLSLNLPFGLGGVEINVDQTVAHAAWDLYVEFATRVTVRPLAAGEGSARQAMDSLYTLFGVTREVLRGAGPGVADGPDALGPVAIRVLNDGLRPFLTRWHPALAAFERAHPDGYADGDWPGRADFDAELAAVQRQVADYIGVLAEVAGVHA